MCVAIPGKIIEINGTIGTVDFNGNIVPVSLRLVEAKVGDYVLVHAGCAMEVLKEDRAEEMIKLFKELEEVLQDD